MFWILSVVETYLMLGFDYDLVVFSLLMTWLYYWSVWWYSAVMFLCWDILCVSIVDYSKMWHLFLIYLL